MIQTRELAHWHQSIDEECEDAKSKAWKEAKRVEVVTLRDRGDNYEVTLQIDKSSGKGFYNNMYVSLGKDENSALIEAVITHRAREETHIELTLRVDKVIVGELVLRRLMGSITAYKYLLRFSSRPYQLMRQIAEKVAGIRAIGDEQNVKLAQEILSETYIGDRFFETQLTVFQGPPGTGKTYRIREILADFHEQYEHQFKPAEILQDIKQGNNRDAMAFKYPQALASAFTNKACLNIANALSEAGIKFISIGIAGVPRRYDYNSNVKAFDSHLALANPTLQPALRQQFARQFVLYCNPVILCTAMRAASWFQVVHRARFKKVILDEASQSQLPIVAGLALLGEEFMAFGDPMQLPPTVLKPVLNDFQPNPLKWTIYDLVPAHKIVFQDYQYRGRPEQYLFLISLFYQGRIKTAKFHPHLHPNLPVLEFLDLSDLNPRDFNRVNDLERQVIQQAINRDWEARQNEVERSPKRIGVVSPFRSQANHLSRELVSPSPETLDLVTGTAHVIQGQTFDDCYFSLAATTRSPFLNPPLKWLQFTYTSMEFTFENIEREAYRLLSSQIYSEIGDRTDYRTIRDEIRALYVEYKGIYSKYIDQREKGGPVEAIQEYYDTNIDYNYVVFDSLKDVDRTTTNLPILTPDTEFTIPENLFAPNIFNAGLSRSRYRLIFVGCRLKNPILEGFIAAFKRFGRYTKVTPRWFKDLAPSDTLEPPKKPPSKKRLRWYFRGSS